MYLPIGNDMAVRESSLIGIFDMDNTSTSKRTREFLEKAQKEAEQIAARAKKDDPSHNSELEEIVKEFGAEQ